ncbi:MAG: hypothetical protein ACREIP_09380 [Alphaproteobacteria bacterium]
MGRIILATLFFMLMALNVAGYLYFVNEIDGSTVKSKKSFVPPEQPGDRRLAR